MENGIVCEVEIETIRISPFQPRRTFSQEELRQLASSIEAMGVIQPPVVRKIESKGRFLYYELIAGERRVRACKLAGKDLIPVLVRETSDEEAAKASLIENVQRVDLDPMETAHALKRLIDIFGLSQEDVARKVGKKRSTVTNYLRLLSLPDAVRSALSQGTISMGHAKAILALDSEEMQAKLHKLIEEQGLSVRQVEARVRKKPAKDPDVVALEARLEERLKTRVEILPRKGQSGKVVIHYHSHEDLDELLSILPQ